jgi:hypothetical protein
MCVDVGDNELASLEAIHVFVELLDRYFGNVCELDLVFNFNKVRGFVATRTGARSRARARTRGLARPPPPPARAPRAPPQVYAILDEYLTGGEMLETSQNVMLSRMHEFDKLIEK